MSGLHRFFKFPSVLASSIGSQLPPLAMLLTPDGLGFFVLTALLVSFISLCFCLLVVWRSRDNRRQTFEAIGLLSISIMAVYASLMLNAFAPNEAAPWKFFLLAALALYILFNIATFPQQSK